MIRMRIAFAAAILLSMSAVHFQAAQQPAVDQVNVTFSDPSKPGIIDVSLVHGSITVRGANRKDVLVIAHPEEDRPSRRTAKDADELAPVHRGPLPASTRCRAG